MGIDSLFLEADDWKTRRDEIMVFLIVGQQNWYGFCKDAMHAKFFRQNFVARIDADADVLSNIAHN